MKGLAIVCACALAVGFLGSRLAAQDAAPSRIVVDAHGMRSDRGRLRCYLFARAEDFPTHPDRAARASIAIVESGRARCTFDGVPNGTYAVALHHDEDGDGAFDTGIFGIPTEGTGASRDARGSMGPPSFADARFDHAGGELRLSIRVGYVF